MHLTHMQNALDTVASTAGKRAHIDLARYRLWQSSQNNFEGLPVSHIHPNSTPELSRDNPSFPPSCFNAYSVRCYHS